MGCSIGTWVGIVVAASLAVAGCGRKDRGGSPRDAGSIRLTQPDGAPLVARVLASPPPGSGELRRCRVALRRPDWGPGSGPLAHVPLKLRTIRGRGTRAEVLRFARESVCREDGISAERCTDDLFVPEYEWCEGDPVPERRPPRPEIQELADRIRAGAGEGQPAQAGASPAGDATPAGPPETADGGPVIF